MTLSDYSSVINIDGLPLHTLFRLFPDPSAQVYLLLNRNNDKELGVYNISLRKGETIRCRLGEFYGIYPVTNLDLFSFIDGIEVCIARVFDGYIYSAPDTPKPHFIQSIRQYPNDTFIFSGDLMGFITDRRSFQLNYTSTEYSNRYNGWVEISPVFY